MISVYLLCSRPRRWLYAGLLTIAVLPFLVLALLTHVAKGAEPVAQQCCEAIVSQDKATFVALFSPQDRRHAEGLWTVLQGLQSALGPVKACDLEQSGITIASNGTGSSVTARLQAQRFTAHIRFLLVCTREGWKLRQAQLSYP